MRHLLDFYGMPNIILNNFKVLKDKIDKNKHTFFQKRAKDCCIQTLLYTYKNEKNNFFSLMKELFKNERHLNLNNFSNRNATTKIRMSSHYLAINATKWYNLHEDTKDFAKIKREKKYKKII